VDAAAAKPREIWQELNLFAIVALYERHYSKLRDHLKSGGIAPAARGR
jgi:hypothetical protein